jgi:cytochrome c-type biogenesis protein CcmH/NrfF
MHDADASIHIYPVNLDDLVIWVAPVIVVVVVKTVHIAMDGRTSLLHTLGTPPPPLAVQSSLQTTMVLLE